MLTSLRAAYPALMRLLDRYLLRELLMPLVYCLGGFVVFWISFNLFTRLDDLQEAKLHLWDVVELCAAWTPECLVTVLPIALLLALLYTLTHHARHNEITAMRAAGMSLWRLCVPYFAVGFVASLVLFALNEIGVPRSTGWAERILNRYVHKSDDVPNQFHGFTNAQANRIWIFNEYRPQTTEMSGSIVINWTLPDGSIRKLYADRAIYSKPGWTFFNAKEFEQASETAPVVPFLQTNELAMPDFDETPAGIENEIKMSEYESLHSRKLNIPLSVLWEYLRRHPNLPAAEAANWWTKFDGRLAAPWTCLVVVLIAIPFGVASGRRNLFVGVAGSVFICFTFFVLQQVGLAMGQGDRLPAWLAAWLPNLFFAAAGLLLTARVR
ncbi:MAG: LptF/LptG family permease [Verrucomicrobiia bacterium]